MEKFGDNDIRRTYVTWYNVSLCSVACIFHYENTPMQYTENNLVVKMKIFTGKNLIFFLLLLKT